MNKYASKRHQLTGLALNGDEQSKGELLRIITEDLNQAGFVHPLNVAVVVFVELLTLEVCTDCNNVRGSKKKQCLKCGGRGYTGLTKDERLDHSRLNAQIWDKYSYHSKVTMYVLNMIEKMRKYGIFEYWAKTNPNTASCVIEERWLLNVRQSKSPG